MHKPIRPLAPPPVWEEAVEALLVRAVARGRRDGLQQADAEAAQHPAAAEASGNASLPLDLQPILQIALRHCYIAGHLHGAEVRRENDRRVARQEPLLSLL